MTPLAPDAANRARARDIHRRLREIRHSLHTFTFLLELAMATKDDLSAKLDELEQAIKDDEAADDANEVTMQKIIDDLRAQVKGNPDIQAVIDRLDVLKSNLHAPTPPV